MSEAPVTLGIIVSRSEALVVRALLEQHGIVTHLGGEYHASVEVIPLALGGFRLSVPAEQHRAASEILRKTYGEEEWKFSYGLRRAVLRIWIVWAVFVFLGFVAYEATAPAFEKDKRTDWALFVLGAASFPVNPQGSSEYYLADKSDG